MTTISLLAYAEGYPETGTQTAPKIPLTIDIDYTEKEITDYKNGVTAGAVGIAIRHAIDATDFGQTHASIGWKSSTITIVGGTTTPPAPTGLQLTVQKTVAVRSVEHVDMAKHWTAFGAYVTSWLDDTEDCVLKNTFGYVLESYFRSIAGASIISLVVKA